MLPGEAVGVRRWESACPLQVGGLHFYMPGREEGYWVIVKLGDSCPLGPAAMPFLQ